MKLTNENIITKARSLGFDLIGFAEATILFDAGQRLDEWLGKGFQAGMKYMNENREKRIDVSNILPGAKSVISLGMNYNSGEQHDLKPNTGKVSRYAWGKDYHLVIWEKLNRLEKELKNLDPSFESKSYVDTGPVMDKAWAVKTGLGWLGKHTNIINKQMGSWFFISTVITNCEFDYSSPVLDFCGDCTACIDACPTNAIVDEYVLDSNKCISYLTIENKSEAPEEFRGQFDNWLFGCDICQDVCPWNKKFSVITNEASFQSMGNKEIDLDEVENMTGGEFKKRFAESPINRARLKGLKRNAAFLKR
ncbi:MAG: tRNA epoxyqueuosine(34) reductase QueG [bacterium]